jgi:CheY-like chemotaxis protein
VRLRQILVNLVANAIKFTDAGSVELRLGSNAVDGAIRFAVADTGVGMSAEQLARLFRPFSQVDASPARRHAGTGLGLVISRRLAQALGGELDAVSEPARGSTFVLTLPANVALAGAIPAEAASAAKQTFPDHAPRELTGRVLLVEDGADNRRLFVHILTRAGLEVATAENGRIAVDLLLADGRAAVGRFDLILMDMQMPELDGYEATRRLRAAGVGLPIIAVTAHAMVEELDRCIGVGCNAYVAKPVDRRRLLEVVAQWLAATPAAAGLG